VRLRVRVRVRVRLRVRVRVTVRVRVSGGVVRVRVRVRVCDVAQRGERGRLQRRRNAHDILEARPYPRGLHSR